MASSKLKKKILDILKDGYFNDEYDFVDISDGFKDLIHVVVVSSKFNEMKLEERDDIIWNEILQFLSDDEWSKISLLIANTPEEVIIS